MEVFRSRPATRVVRRLEVAPVIADPYPGSPFRKVIRALLCSPAARLVREVPKLMPNEADDVVPGQSKHPASHRHDSCNPLTLTLGARIVALRAGRVGAVRFDDY